MYMNELKRYFKALESYAKMTEKTESWNKYVRICIKGMREALDGLEKEIDLRETKSIKPVNMWTQPMLTAEELRRVKEEQFW